MLNVQNYVNSIENCVHQMYRLSGFVQKFIYIGYVEFIDCVNLTENCIHQMSILYRFVEKFKYVGHVEFTELCKFNGKLCK